MREAPVTEVQRVENARRRRARRIVLVLGGALALFLIFNLGRFFVNETPIYMSEEEHFKYGSIGSEPESGLPVWMWKALPVMFPDDLNKGGLETFGFIYEEGRELPIGVSERTYRGVELAWLNCAVCHTGTWVDDRGERHIVPGAPANNLEFQGFVSFLFEKTDSGDLTVDSMMEGMTTAGAEFDFIDKLVYRNVVLPRVLNGLKDRSDSLGPMMADQTEWGRGRVDTFNPYKAIQFHYTRDDLDENERYGVSDFPSIFNQRPRGDQQMDLHWDGNNASLQERNLSAAIGAGVTEDTVDHAAIERVAEYLLDLPAPPSPHDVEPNLVEQGRVIYMEVCSACHGYQGADGHYVFEGSMLGRVVPIEEIGTDRARLDSYTADLRKHQISTFFEGDPKYDFMHFKKTNGYSNHPLDGLWIRAPYLHNGSVPTLYDLLLPPAERPQQFVRGRLQLDEQNGGFVSPACDPETYSGAGLCYDTKQPADSAVDFGNRNIGHVYGTDLSVEDREALLEYLKTF